MEVQSLRGLLCNDIIHLLAVGNLLVLKGLLNDVLLPNFRLEVIELLDEVLLLLRSVSLVVIESILHLAYLHVHVLVELLHLLLVHCFLPRISLIHAV